MSRTRTSKSATARQWRLLSVRSTTLFLIVLMCSGGLSAYSVLTHEEIVDLLWSDEIQPLLLKRYPGLSEDQLKQAHAYAYGGAVIQDLGYYPFGSKEFSNLVHYVRSGDFVRVLLLESQDVNEYAFALGALSHYAADIAGHPAVNQSVAIEYTTDDNARALILAVALGQMEHNQRGQVSSSTETSALRYAAFLEHAFNPSKGRFKNFLRYDRRWNEPVGSEDSHGRALWALGTVLGRSEDQGLRGAAGRLFEFSLPAVLEFHSPRAWAYTLLGVQEYLTSYPGDRDAQKIRSALSRRLVDMYDSIRRSDWKWFENVLAYGNARLPQALLLVGAAISDDHMISRGLESLDWLLEMQRCETNGHFVPIGSQGFCHQDGQKARFDQQPLEAAGAVSSCLQAYRVTNDDRWRNEAWSAFNWFLGDNDLQLPLYDSITGGCRDGLHPERANENQGAESTLSFLMALLEMQSLQDTEQKETIS